MAWSSSSGFSASFFYSSSIALVTCATLPPPAIICENANMSSLVESAMSSGLLASAAVAGALASTSLPLLFVVYESCSKFSSCGLLLLVFFATVAGLFWCTVYLALSLAACTKPVVKVFSLPDENISAAMTASFVRDAAPHLPRLLLLWLIYS